MSKRKGLRALLLGFSFAAMATAAGCMTSDLGDALGVAQSEITDVPHTPVERQSIGNCWLYAEASWVESMNLSYIEAHPATTTGGGPAHSCEHLLCETGEKLENGCMPADTDHASCLAKICEDDSYCCDTEWDDICVNHILEKAWCETSVCEAPVSGGVIAPVEPLDVSQSYWTYWHWFDQVTGYMYSNEISTGGNTWTSHAIIRDRGVMHEIDFVPEDSAGEMSQRQSAALSKINAALKDGQLKSQEARRNGKLVREVFDEAWGLAPEVRAQLDKAFGEDGSMKIRSGASVEGTKIMNPLNIPVRYAKRVAGEVQYKDTHLVDAIAEWQTVRNPSGGTAARDFQIRVQRALHAQQPVVITWDVDFNAMENGQNDRRGSFNLKTLNDAGRPGSQGGHMTVLEDYEAVTEAYGVLAAGITLDPSNVEDAAKLEAALLPSTSIKLFRTKNSWGGQRPDRAFAPGFPGYHDLWMDYLNGPIKWCPNESSPTNDNCRGESRPFRDAMLPPGF